MLLNTCINLIDANILRLHFSSFYLRLMAFIILQQMGGMCGVNKYKTFKLNYVTSYFIAATLILNQIANTRVL